MANRGLKINGNKSYIDKLRAFYIEYDYLWKKIQSAIWKATKQQQKSTSRRLGSGK